MFERLIRNLSNELNLHSNYLFWKKDHLLISMSLRRAGLWCPSYCSSMGKILLGLTSILIVAGFLAAILTPLLNSISKALPSKNIYVPSYFFAYLCD